jgi:lipid-binding SYLF domain-containing protein
MFKNLRFAQGLFILIAATAALGLPRPAAAQSTAAGSTAPGQTVLDHDAQAALKSLYSTAPAAKALGDKAVGVLVFPEIRKAAFLVGAQGGDGVLFEKGRPSAYYNSGALSVGLQAGAQSYGYALFFMRPEDMEYLKQSNGWSLGVGPSIVVVDAGMARDVSTLSGQPGVYAFIFDQKGLMAGLGLVGQKITPIQQR